MKLKQEVSMTLIPEHDSERMVHAESLVELSGEKIASVFYEVVKNRLQHVNSWSIIANRLSATFQLINKQGIEVYRKAQEGDFLKMDLIKAGGLKSTSNDWFRIEAMDTFAVEDGVESFGFRVRASVKPNQYRHTGYPSIHDDTRTFIVSRVGSTVRASVYQVANSPGHERTSSKAHIDEQQSKQFREGSMVRFSYVEWMNLTDGLISRDHH